jgi:hypothetical protein
MDLLASFFSSTPWSSISSEEEEMKIQVLLEKGM